MPKIFHRLLLVSAFTLLASACVYRINIQQGNYRDQVDVDPGKSGLTRRQVHYLLGQPMVSDRLNTKSWDYI